MNRYSYLDGYKVDYSAAGYFNIGNRVKLRKEIWNNLPWNNRMPLPHRSTGTIIGHDAFGYIVDWEDNDPTLYGYLDSKVWMVDDLEVS